jgi:hypothetical protein
MRWSGEAARSRRHSCGHGRKEVSRRVAHPNRPSPIGSADCGRRTNRRLFSYWRRVLIEGNIKHLIRQF